jgi:hypothetical protein
MKIVTANKGLFVPLLFNLLFIEPAVLKKPVSESAHWGVQESAVRINLGVSLWDHIPCEYLYPAGNTGFNT